MKKYITQFILVLIPILIAAYFLSVTLTYPYIGLDGKKTADGVWEISYIDSMGWGKAQNIQVGDRIKAIDAKDPSSYSTLIKFGSIEQADSITVQHLGQTTTYIVPLGLIPSQVTYHTLLPAMVFTVCLGFSIFLLRRKRNSSTFILTLFFLALGISYLSAGASARADVFAKFIVATSFLFVPVLLLHFLYLYFKSLNIGLFPIRFLSLLYGFNGSLLMVQLLFLLSRWGNFYTAMSFVQLASFSMSTLYCLYIIISRYLQFRQTVYRPIFKILGTGVILAFFPFVGLVALPRILIGEEVISGALAALFLIILPLTFLYLITANHLLDIDFIINRLKYYSILSIFPAALIMWVILVGMDINLSYASGIKLFLFCYLITLIFLYLKERISYQLRSRLFIEKYNFQASLDRLSQYLSQVKKVADLEERLIIEIKEVLQVENALVVETDKSGHLLRFQDPLSDLPKEQIEKSIRSGMDWQQMGSIIPLDRGYGVCLMIGDYADRFSLVWISNKLNRTQFNRDELVWLKTVAHYVNMVYKNLALIEGLVEELQSVIEKHENPPWVSRLLFNLSEKERRMLASDLHDAALQDQLLWFRKLESIVRDKETPYLVKKELEPIKEGLLDVIYQIRETCNELRPPFLVEKGIVEVLENLFEYTKLRTNFIIRFESDELENPLDDEQMLAIYRIVQELLANAEKHSQASEVEIRLFQEKSGFSLVYRDNGMGIKPEFLNPSFQNMGISGMKERVRSLNGIFTIKTAVGQGLEVTAWIPFHMQHHSILQQNDGGFV